VLDVKKLRRVFGDAVKNVWIPREAEDLDALVKEREQTAYRLEKAEILLINKANDAYRKAKKAGHPDIETFPESPASGKYNVTEVTVTAGTESPTSPREFSRTDGTPIEKASYGFLGPSWEINGSVAAQWIPASQRPRHRPIANYGRRVDTIKWTRAQLKDLAPKISKLRREYRKGAGKPIPAAFVEFHTQVDAQSAYQTLAHHRANHMRSEIVGVRPQEIIWPSLYLPWWERIIRRFLIQAFIASMVIFWSIPAVFVGSISNVQSLTARVFFLRWINDLPSVVVGLISGLLPAIMLSVLMSAVPFIMRGMLLLMIIWPLLTIIFKRALGKQAFQLSPRLNSLFRTPTSFSRLFRSFSSQQSHLLQHLQLLRSFKIPSRLDLSCLKICHQHPTSTFHTSSSKA
jgi:hypothetical protein